MVEDQLATLLSSHSCEGVGGGGGWLCVCV